MIQHRTQVSIFAALLLLITLLLPLPANAWNAAGHRLSALIAWQQLDETTRGEISRILRHHPDYERWVAHAKDITPELAAFVEASTWPDDIKRDKRFFDAERDEATPALPGFPDMARHRHWHYIDRPLGHSQKRYETNGELDQQIDLLTSTVGNRKINDQHRAYALPWLIHLIADAHQPLHTVSRYDAEGRRDEGGNRLIIKHPFHPRLSSMSLHTYWDDLPGPPWLRGRYLERAANAIVATYPPTAPTGEANLWIDESWKIAREGAYPAENDEIPTLTADFHEAAQATARKRIAEAGYRLAARLRQLLGHQR